MLIFGGSPFPCLGLEGAKCFREASELSDVPDTLILVLGAFLGEDDEIPGEGSEVFVPVSEGVDAAC